MAQQVIFLGTNPNDGTGESLRGAGSAINNMMTELYALLSDTINAGAVAYDHATTVGRIQLAIDAAVLLGKSRVFVPAQYLPYDASLVTFNNGVQMVREGGNSAVDEVISYGAEGVFFPATPTVDATASIQAALNTGRNVDLVGLTYSAHGLTTPTQDQVLYSSQGMGRIVKNANGDLFTTTGDGFQVRNVEFRGESPTPSFTGHNVVSTGARFSMTNCGSRYAYGRAVKATGDRVQIIGSQEIYQTADQTVNGYDIEIGVSGTATLYHQLYGIYSGQGSITEYGGIKFIDTGSATVLGGQFGKLTISSGTSPAGVNGGMTVGVRILGATTIGLSGANLTNNQFGPVAIVVNADISGVRMDESNTYQNGCTITNNGNLNNVIVRGLETGGLMSLRFGDDASLATLIIEPNTGFWEFPKSIRVGNLQCYRMETVAGTDGGQLLVNGQDRVQLENLTASKDILHQLAAGTGSHRFFTNGGTEALKVDHSTTAGQTRLLLYDVDNATLERVTVGIADSGGAGFKVLRIPN